MFRIKPTRNQTTAKHVNLSPYPNDQLLLDKKIQPKISNKVTIKDKYDNKIIGKVSDINPVNNFNNVKLKPNANDLNEQSKKGQVTVNNLPQKQLPIYNPQKVIKQLINPIKNISLLPKNHPNIASKPHERVLLKRSENHKEHKIKMDELKNKQTQHILPLNNNTITTLKKGQFINPVIIKRKQSALNNRHQKVQVNELGLKKQQKHQKPKEQVMQLAKKYNGIISNQNLQVKIQQNPQRTKLIPQKNVQIKPQRNNSQFISLTKPQISFQQKQSQKHSKHQQKDQKYQQKNEKRQYKDDKQKLKDNQQDQKDEKQKDEKQKDEKQKDEKQKDEKQKYKQKQKQMQDLMLKIQKRRQARQQQKKRLKQIQQKRKQNQQRALQFINSRNNRDNIDINAQPNQGVTGMLKLNDQLMHFSLAQTIMDLQVKKILKTNFDQFPNKSQIMYQIDELQRINLSYEMIRDDQDNPLRNGLQNYRVQIFNKIGDLIMEAQEGGYTNPNFHILEHDGRLPQGPNSIIPEAVRGLPEESHNKFIKYEKSNQEDECTICLGEIKFGEICANIECGHKFHSSCIKEWVKSSANCPTCRFNIKFGRKDNINGR